MAVDYYVTGAICKRLSVGGVWSSIVFRIRPNASPTKWVAFGEEERRSAADTRPKGGCSGTQSIPTSTTKSNHLINTFPRRCNEFGLHRYLRSAVAAHAVVHVHQRCETHVVANQLF